MKKKTKKKRNVKKNLGLVSINIARVKNVNN